MSLDVKFIAVLDPPNCQSKESFDPFILKNGRISLQLIGQGTGLNRYR